MEENIEETIPKDDVLENDDIEDDPIENDTNKDLIESNSVNGESILSSIKKLLGIPDADKSFDLDISIHINTVFMTLNQLGVGPDKTFSIQNADATWTDFFEDRMDLNGVKTLVYLKVRIIFDPPSSSSVLEAYNNQITELEWRLNMNCETINKDEEGNSNE